MGTIMSRHRIPSKLINYTTVVGWDKPTQSFFATVEDSTREEDQQVIFSQGADFQSTIEDVDELRDLISPYAILSAEMGAILEDEKLNSDLPSPLQSRVRR